MDSTKISEIYGSRNKNCRIPSYAFGFRKINNKFTNKRKNKANLEK